MRALLDDVARRSARVVEDAVDDLGAKLVQIAHHGQQASDHRCFRVCVSSIWDNGLYPASCSECTRHATAPVDKKLETATMKNTTTDSPTIAGLSLAHPRRERDMQRCMAQMGASLKSAAPKRRAPTVLGPSVIHTGFYP